MVDYSHADLFLNQNFDKKIKIVTDDGKDEITNSELHQGHFELSESLCSESSLRFGSCEASSVSFRVSSVYTALKGKKITVSIAPKGKENEPMQIGKYKVFSDVLTSDVEHRQREVTAYDAMYDIIKADVAGWYNTVLPNKESTMTLKQFRTSFISHFGLEQEEAELVNDGMVIERTIDPSEISGENVITAICEINGCFGHIGRDGKFHYIYLPQSIQGLYPANDLYPADDLFPTDPKGRSLGKGAYIKCKPENFTTREITKLQIRKEENDIGVTYPPSPELTPDDNCYIIQDNFLVYGKSEEELQEIAANIYGKIIGLTYRPFDCDALGNPCIEVGDAVRFSTKYDLVETYILQRTLTGVNSARDKYSASGTERYGEETNGIRNSIIQLKGKTNTLTRTLDETRLEMGDIEQGLSTEISVTAGQIRTELNNEVSGLKNTIEVTASGLQGEIEDTKNGLQTQITANANGLSAEITRATGAEGELSTQITVTAESINLSVSKQIEETKEYAETQAEGALSSANASTDEKLKKYSTTVEMNSSISQTAESITSNVNKQITETKTYADTQATSALNSANSATDEKLKSYSTTAQMNSAIEQTAESINLSVSKNIQETKTYADTQATSALNSANSATDEKLKSYSTITQMNSAIGISAEEIRTDVSKTYETKDDAGKQYSSLSSSISQTSASITAEVKRATTEEGKLSTSISSVKQTADGIYADIYNSGGLKAQIQANASSISSKVSIGEISSEISQEAGKISIKSNRFSLQSTNCTITEAGKITAKEVDITGKITATSGTIGGAKIENGTLKVSTANITGALTIGQLPDTVAQKSEIPTSAQITTITENTIKTTDVVATNLHVKSANIDGKLSATSIDVTDLSAFNAKIGGFTIGSKAIYNGTNSISSTTAGVYVGTDGFRNYYNSNSYTTINGGKLTTNNADITGKITATSGHIGSSTKGFNITENSIYNGKTSVSDTTHSGIYIGTDGIACGTYVTYYKATSTTSWTQTTKPSFQITSSGDVSIGIGTITVGNSPSTFVTGGGVTVVSTTQGNTGSASFLQPNSLRLRSSNLVYTDFSNSKISSAGGNFGIDVGGKSIFSATTNGYLGFFGATPVAKQTVSTISSTSSATASSTATKINEVINALKKYGLM